MSVHNSRSCDGKFSLPWVPARPHRQRSPPATPPLLRDCYRSLKLDGPLSSFAPPHHHTTTHHTPPRSAATAALPSRCYRRTHPLSAISFRRPRSTPLFLSVFHPSRYQSFARPQSRHTWSVSVSGLCLARSLASLARPLRSHPDFSHSKLLCITMPSFAVRSAHVTVHDTSSGPPTSTSQTTTRARRSRARVSRIFPLACPPARVRMPPLRPTARCFGAPPSFPPAPRLVSSMSRRELRLKRRRPLVYLFLPYFLPVPPAFLFIFHFPNLPRFADFPWRQLQVRHFASVRARDCPLASSCSPVSAPRFFQLHGFCRLLGSPTCPAPFACLPAPA